MLNRKNETGLIGKKVRIRPSFISATKDAVSGTNGYSGKFRDDSNDNDFNYFRMVTQSALLAYKGLSKHMLTA